MDLAIQLRPTDPWLRQAVNRLESRFPESAAIFRSGGRRPEWEMQDGCEFCLTLERVIANWEAMEAGHPSRPSDAGRDVVSAADSRRDVYGQFFRFFKWAEVETPKGGRFVIGGLNLRSMNRVIWNLRGTVHDVPAAQAFDRAYACQGIWWAF